MIRSSIHLLMKKVIFSFTMLCITALLQSHEFWLEPQYYIFQRGEEINLRMRVGEHFTGENWKGNREKINAVKLYFRDFTDDLSSHLSNATGDSIQFKIFEEGTAMVTFNNKNSFITLDAAQFNAYLEEDGITEAIAYRKAHQETDSAGREYYQRSVKCLLQVGQLKTDNVLQKTDLPLDIVPQANPYRLGNGDTLALQILFKGEPLSGKRMRIWHRLAGKVTEEQTTTDANGKMRIAVKNTGEWMISCVAMERLENDSLAQWQSYWGSLTWGYTRNPQKLPVLRGH